MDNRDSHSAGRTGYSRRAFLKGGGAAAAATALVTGELVAAEPAKDERSFGPGATNITLNVNGRKHQIDVEPRMTLLEVLRYKLNLTGAKPVSDDGVGGACTVLVAGKPISASTTLAMECVGKPITTAEGLVSGKRADLVAAAFVGHDASQCGFCTPGYVVAVKAFLSKNPKATEAEIRRGLNGNICRCGTYANVIQAALAVVRGGRNA